MTPTPRPRAIVYVIVDRNDPNPLAPAPVGVGLTRKACRDAIQFDPEADNYRIRRAGAVLYES